MATSNPDRDNQVTYQPLAELAHNLNGSCVENRCSRIAGCVHRWLTQRIRGRSYDSHQPHFALRAASWQGVTMRAARWSRSSGSASTSDFLLVDLRAPA